jgi:outer membrane protein OmpA-like peptidoglycan-associated protein
MRQFSFLLTALLGAAAPAFAQVTVDLHALDAVPGSRPATQAPSAAHRTAPRAPAKRTAVAKPTQPQITSAPAQPSVPAHAPAAEAAASAPSTAPAISAPPATLPNAPPPTIALAPIAPPPPAAQPAPPPAPPISDAATSAAATTGAGLRVTFGSGQSDLSPASATAIKNLVQTASPGDSTSFNVVAYAAGTPEDPSTARRLSLARALAVRSALMADGVGSARIYVRALGATAGDATPDRVDLAVLGGNAPAASPANASAPADSGTKSQSP